MNGGALGLLGAAGCCWVPHSTSSGQVFRGRRDEGDVFSRSGRCVQFPGECVQFLARFVHFRGQCVHFGGRGVQFSAYALVGDGARKEGESPPSTSSGQGLRRTAARLTTDGGVGCAEDGRVRDPPPFGRLRAGSTQEEAEDAGMTGMCPLRQADVSSFGPDVSTFWPNVSSFHPNVSTWAGQVSSEEEGGERTSGIDVATRRKGRRNSE